MKAQTVSPLKHEPARLPGQSVDEEIGRVVDRFLSERMAIVTMFVVIAIYDWIRWYTDTPINPYLTSALAAVAAAWFVYGYMRTRTSLTRLKLGRDGERAVGMLLERARTLGYHVLHDIPSHNANIDHVIVGPGGVFTIETKTYSKPLHGGCVIHYNAAKNTLHKGSHDISSCLVQAKAQAGELRFLMEEYSCTNVPIQPVVVFPGWFIQCTERTPGEVWVLEPKAFLKWIEKVPTALAPDQINATRQILSRHVLEK